LDVIAQGIFGARTEDDDDSVRQAASRLVEEGELDGQWRTVFRRLGEPDGRRLLAVRLRPTAEEHAAEVAAREQGRAETLQSLARARDGGYCSADCDHPGIG
jgi:hypothetical protein